jgi:UTP--glucose-1-phosphate uridylyltransferase
MSDQEKMNDDPQSTTPGDPMDLRTAAADHARNYSLLGFQESSSARTALQMREELNRMAAGVADEAEKKQFQNEMSNFHELFTRYLQEKSSRHSLDWKAVKSPSTDKIIPYANLTPPSAEQTKIQMSKLAVLKLNGGLGTTMGCVGPKSAIEVRDGMSFLDMTVRQIGFLNKEHKVQVPLILMNSFNTDSETARIIQKYNSNDTKIMTFNQSRFPRIQKESHLPLPHDAKGTCGDWYPPGHGDLFEALHHSGTLDALLAEGKEYLFVSNVDNLGATVDLNIMNHFVQSQTEFIMEVTDKTKADIKGGTLIEYENTIRLLEIAQVPKEHVF